MTINDFRHGRPQVLLQADKHPKILLLWQHGDERLGPNLGHYIYNQRPDLMPHIDYICGNPQAANQEPAAHWIDADLNRSYGQAAASNAYETGRAKEIMAMVREAGYDFVLDLHTSVTDIGHFAIISQLSQAVRQLISASNEQRVVVLSPELSQVSIAGQFDNVLALEYNQALADQPKTIEQVVEMLERLIGSRPLKPSTREVFYIDGPIPKSEDPGLDARNFELCKDGYYPVLFGTGKRSYREDPTKTYLGFAARRREELVL